MDRSQLSRVLAERNGLPHVDLNMFAWDRAAASLLETAKARRYGALPVAFMGEGVLLVATADPANVLAVDDITMATGYEVRRAVASPDHIQGVIAQLSELDEAVHEVEEGHVDVAEVIELREGSDQAPIIKLVNSIIADAVERGASDIHLEPRRGDLRVRYRVDGVVFDATMVPRRLAASVTSRIKLMSDMDIAERRLPQDGRVGLTVDGRFVDLRVATLPVVRGEAIIIRVLDKGRVALELEALGMGPVTKERFAAAIDSRSGAVLVTGPTGAGKTTTLYAALHAVNTPDRTLVTLEDPVEYELEGVKQVQVNPRTGLTFATGLRSMVRADPDVLMVGEVRDRETAQIAVESALTGHLVLTTLHTNNAPMASARLIEMGIEPFLVASGVDCVLAQRLVRRLCDDCKRPVKLTKAALCENGFDAQRGFNAWEPVGCVRCTGTGYRGRTGVYELLTMSPRVRDLVLARASGDELRAVALEEGMTTLRDDGLEKIRHGVTSAPEVLRVLGTSAA
jgi:type IV pilus assembly protein PilB